MYKISVPIMNVSLNKENREEYLHLLKEAAVQRVFLVIFGFGGDAAELEETIAALSENAAFLEKNGIEVAVWIGATIGHGSALAAPGSTDADGSAYSPLMNLSGQVIPNTRCPMDERFRRDISAFIGRIAETGIKIIMLDDDFRLSQHGPDFCCACDAHLAEIRRLCGEDVSREELRHLVFESKANKYRTAWLTAQRQSMEQLASDIRAAVDAVSKDVQIALCTPHCSYGVDGTNPLQTAKILAGENSPILRLHGAPYWAVHTNRTMAVVLEIARSSAFFFERKGAELMAEGDAYPRPRYNMPSSYLELYDAAIRADGRYNGILKYMVDYNATVGFETGYLRRHSKNLPLMEQISEIFHDKMDCGVNVSVDRDIFSQADFELGKASAYYPYPLAGVMMSSSSLPTAYGEGGICYAVFGEQARHIQIDRIAKGAILDSIAAEILRQRGVDVGLTDTPTFQSVTISGISPADGSESGCIFPGQMRWAQMTMVQNAELVFTATEAGKRIPFAYRYSNASGAKFLIFSFDAMSLSHNSGIYRGYLQQKLLKDAAQWISGEKMPAYIEGCPGLYMICKKGSNSMAVLLLNAYADTVDEPVIELDKTYSSIRFIGCNGRLDGNIVTLDTPIAAFGLAAFEVVL